MDSCLQVSIGVSVFLQSFQNTKYFVVVDKCNRACQSSRQKDLSPEGSWENQWELIKRQIIICRWENCWLPIHFERAILLFFSF